MKDNLIRSVVMFKGHEKYVFRFRSSTRPALLATSGRYADDPGLSFTWHDAAEVAKATAEECSFGNTFQCIGSDDNDAIPHRFD